MREEYKKNKKIFQKVLAEIIKEQRENQGKSITLISAEIGMTKSMWRDLEREIKDPQLTTIWRIAEALDIPLSTIILELEKRLGKEFLLTEQ